MAPQLAAAAQGHWQCGEGEIRRLDESTVWLALPCSICLFVPLAFHGEHFLAQAAGHALYNGKHGSNVDIKSLFFAPDPNRFLSA